MFPPWREVRTLERGHLRRSTPGQQVREGILSRGNSTGKGAGYRLNCNGYSVCRRASRGEDGQTKQLVKCLEGRARSLLHLEQRVKNEATGQEGDSPSPVP